MTIELPLDGGRVTAGVVLVGCEVRRPTGPHSARVHDVLNELERSGFDGAPRYLGLDERGRERLSYLAGWVPPDLDQATWSDEQLIAAAKLMRQFHDALAGTAVADGAETVCHNDLGPCNAVHVGGLPTAFIDWDAASPGARIVDVAHAVWRWVIMSDTDELSFTEQVRRVAIMIEAYGGIDPRALMDAVVDNQDRVIASAVRTGDRASEEWHSGERAWFIAYRDAFIRALS